MGKWLDLYRSQLEVPEKPGHAQDKSDNCDRSPILPGTEGEQPPFVTNVTIVQGITRESEPGADYSVLLSGTPETIPDEWKNGIVHLQAMHAPQGWPRDHWQQVQRMGLWLLRLWAVRLLEAGWPTLEVFGVSPVKSFTRLDLWGLLPGMPGKTVADIRPDYIETTTIIGKRQRHYRNHKGMSGAILLWDLTRAR